MYSERSLFGGLVRRFRPDAQPSPATVAPPAKQLLAGSSPEERRELTVRLLQLLTAIEEHEASKQSRPTTPKHRVIEALERIGRPVTNAELAKLLNLSPSRTTRLRQEVADRLRVERRGRHVFISLAR